MAGSKAPSGSLRAHASTAEKARSSSALNSFKPVVTKWKKSEFVGDDSGSSSSGSSDSDDSDNEKEDASDFKKRISQTPSSKNKATPVKATPAKTPTVNGLTASAKKVAAGKKIKKEETSSSSASSASESDSESSSDEEDTKASAKGKQAKQTKSQPKPKSESSDESETSSESESESESDHAKKPKAKTDKKPVAQTKASAKPLKKEETTSESESGSEESESENGDEEDSEDARDQIAQQITNDVQAATTAKAQTPASNEGTRKSKAKATKTTKAPTPDDDDGDVEMMDQSTALTNGGSPTKVGSVPEFVAPDFHLRKLDGNIDATDVASFFEKAKMDGKQVWYITAPASLPVTVVQDLTIPMDQAQKGLPVLSHNGDDYRMAFDNPAASSSFRLLIPNKNGDEYSMLERPVNQTMHFTRSETFPADGPASIVTTQTVATIKPARPQPQGLKSRYTPLGVPSPKPTLAPPANSKKRNAAAQETAATSSKKKRKHGDDGENGPAAATPAQKETSGKNITAEKPAKKQKTNKVQEKAPVAQSGRKETPVPLPLPPQANGGSSVKKPSARKPKASPVVRSASQPAPDFRRSASPGARLPSTQIPVRQTPVPVPMPKPAAHLVDLTGSAASSDTKKGRKKKDKKEETPKPQAKVQLSNFEEALANIRTPKRVTPIPPPRFGTK